MPTVPYRSFAAGEVSKRLAARVDQVKYQTGARTMRNMVPTLEGAAQNRAGLGYVRPAHDFTDAYPPRVIPFVFNDDQSYVIVLQNGRLSVISNAEPLLDGAKGIGAITVANPGVINTGGPAHGYETGDLIWIDGCGGMVELNRRFFRAVRIDATHYSLQEEAGEDIDTTGFSAYTSGGYSQGVHTIDAPWDGEDLRAIRFAQSADVMVLTHDDYPPYKLERLGGVWTLSLAVFGPVIGRPTDGIMSGTAGSATVRYRVTAVDQDTLEESLTGSARATLLSYLVEVAPNGNKTVTNITAANPPVVTSAAHGYDNGDVVYISGIGGMVEVNNRFFIVANKTANTFELLDEYDNPVEAAGYTAFSSNGTCARHWQIQGVTPSAHGLSDNDEVTFAGLGAPFTSFNDGTYIVRVINSVTFRLKRVYGVVGQDDNPSTGSVMKTSISSVAITEPASGTPITVSWDAVSNALEYNIYRSINGIFGYVGTSATLSFIDKGYDIDPVDTPPIDRDRFAAADDYPLAVGLFQQRLILAGSRNDRERVDASKTGLFYNFTHSNPIQSDDSFGWVMASNQVQAVRHILEMSRCIIFTAGSVFTLEGDDAGTLLPTAINPRLRAQHGVGDVAPMAIGNAVLYVQAFGKVVREILPGSGDDFNAKDLTIYSRHLFDRNSIIAWAYSEEPVSIVWCARDDGKFLSFVYQREHEVWGWSPHDTGAGDRVVDMCSVPEGEETATYMVVRRFGVGLGDRYYIERMASRQIAHAADGKFLDSFRFYEDVNTLALNEYSLSHGDDGWKLTGNSYTDNWVSGDVGRVILVYGPEGERFWCTITELVGDPGADEVLVTVRTDIEDILDDDGAPNAADVAEEDGIPFPFALPYTTNDYSFSISEVTDLWHLEGREVYVVADGYAQGPFTVEDGTITLEANAVLVVVGLQIVADLVTLEPENMEGGQTWADRTKTVGKVTVRVEETDGLQVGLSVASLQAWNPRNCEEDTHVEGFLYTGRITVENEAKQTRTGSVLMRQSSGLPTTILGAYPQIEIGDD